MLDIIKKKEYFRHLADGFADRDNHSLKGIQDGWILEQLHNASGLVIVEAGGGNSRVLPRLSNNELYNFEKFEGVGNGPTRASNDPSIKCIPAFVGEFDSSAPAADVLFSISVVEHVSLDNLPSFFEDVFRILKPGGSTLHAIDLPLADTPLTVADRRIEALCSAVERAGLRFRTALAVAPGLTFSCAMASNSDLTQWEWSRISEAARRSAADVQIVSLKLVADKSV